MFLVLRRMPIEIPDVGGLHHGIETDFPLNCEVRLIGSLDGGLALHRTDTRYRAYQRTARKTRYVIEWWSSEPSDYRRPARSRN